MLVLVGAMKSSRRTAPRLLRARLNVALNLRMVFPRCVAQIVGALQVHPKPRIDTEIAAKAQGRVCRDRALALDDLRDTVRRHAQCHRQLVRVYLEGLQELLEQDFARMNWGKLLRHIYTRI